MAIELASLGETLAKDPAYSSGKIAVGANVSFVFVDGNGLPLEVSGVTHTEGPRYPRELRQLTLTTMPFKQGFHRKPKKIWDRTRISQTQRGAIAHYYNQIETPGQFRPRTHTTRTHPLKARDLDKLVRELTFGAKLIKSADGVRLQRHQLSKDVTWESLLAMGQELIMSSRIFTIDQNFFNKVEASPTR